jgi:hypothetical protein
MRGTEVTTVANRPQQYLHSHHIHTTRRQLETRPWAFVRARAKEAFPLLDFAERSVREVYNYCCWTQLHYCPSE